MKILAVACPGKTTAFFCNLSQTAFKTRPMGMQVETITQILTNNQSENFIACDHFESSFTGVVTCIKLLEVLDFAFPHVSKWYAAAGNEFPVTRVDLRSVPVMSSACRVLTLKLVVITRRCPDRGTSACWPCEVCRVQVHSQAWCGTWLCLKSLKSRRGEAREREVLCGGWVHVRIWSFCLLDLIHPSLFTVKTSRNPSELVSPSELRGRAAAPLKQEELVDVVQAIYKDVLLNGTDNLGHN